MRDFLWTVCAEEEEDVGVMGKLDDEGAVAVAVVVVVAVTVEVEARGGEEQDDKLV